jgi:hypothetical protein
LNPPACPKLENIPKEVLLGSFYDATLSSSCPVKNLQDRSSMKATMAFSVVKNVRQPDAVLTAEENLFTAEMAVLVILETGWDVREDEQLNYSCFKMSVGQEIVTKLANPMDQVEKIEMFGGYKMATELANPSDQVEKSMDFEELCDTVQAKNSSVMYNEMYAKMYTEMYAEMHGEMYDAVYGVMYAEMYDEMCSNVFNRERMSQYNICKPVYIQQCDNGYEVEREEKQEQLAYSCYNIKWVRAESSSFVSIQARADSITAVIMQPSTKYKLS